MTNFESGASMDIQSNNLEAEKNSQIDSFLDNAIDTWLLVIDELKTLVWPWDLAWSITIFLEKWIDKATSDDSFWEKFEIDFGNWEWTKQIDIDMEWVITFNWETFIGQMDNLVSHIDTIAESIKNSNNEISKKQSTTSWNLMNKLKNTVSNASVLQRLKDGFKM